MLPDVGAFRLRPYAKAVAKDSEQGKAWLLVSDVDDTLVGDDASWTVFVEVVQRSPSMRVALNSSRPIASIQKTLRDLPGKFEPDAIIGAMGTELLMGGDLDEGWTEQFADWDRAVVDRVMADLGHEPHDDEFQTPYKASFAVPAGQDQGQAAQALNEAGLDFKIVASGQSDFDVLPPTADKGRATLHAAERLNVSLRRLIVAGDSANDLAMFQVAAHGIVVGNGRDELKQAAPQHRTYFARRERAAGVIEGLVHFGAPIA